MYLILAYFDLFEFSAAILEKGLNNDSHIRLNGFCQKALYDNILRNMNRDFISFSSL